MKHEVQVKHLSFPCVTRKRGKEAAEKLQAYIGNEPVVVILNGVEMLSLSFLDGLISDLASHDNTEKVVFDSINPIVEDKLARVAAIRDVSIIYRSANEIRHITPKTSVPHDAQFVPMKP